MWCWWRKIIEQCMPSDSIRDSFTVSFPTWKLLYNYIEPNLDLICLKSDTVHLQGAQQRQLLYYSRGAEREPLKTCLRDEKRGGSRGHVWAPLHRSEKLERLDAHWTLEQNTVLMLNVQFEMKSLLLTPDVSTDNERWQETKCREIFQNRGRERESAREETWRL